jgi:hypothetical protein
MHGKRPLHLSNVPEHLCMQVPADHGIRSDHLMHILITHVGISHAPCSRPEMRMLDYRRVQHRLQFLKDGSREIPSVEEIDEKMPDLTPSRPDLRIHVVEVQRI